MDQLRPQQDERLTASVISKEARDCQVTDTPSEGAPVLDAPSNAVTSQCVKKRRVIVTPGEEAAPAPSILASDHEIGPSSLEVETRHSKSKMKKTRTTRSRRNLQAPEATSARAVDEESNVYWVVQYDDGGKCSVINEKNNIVSIEDDTLPAIGVHVQVVIAQNKATGRHYRALLLKGPFERKDQAKSALSLCATPLDAVPLPRSCPSCKQLMTELQHQKALTDTLRKCYMCNVKTNICHVMR